MMDIRSSLGALGQGASANQLVLNEAELVLLVLLLLLAL